MTRAPRRAVALAAAGALLATGGLAAPAQAHGPVAPVASSYLARVDPPPVGVDAKVVDGDQRMWLSVAPSQTVVILDYRGGPYLRFSSSGVAVNTNSAMYYLNQTPAEIPPTGVSPRTPPSWERVSGGHDYGWHDGRLHALASVALSPGMTYVGQWRIPILIDGRLSSLLGGVEHADDPSIVWLWPIAVIFLCVLAGLRLRRPRLDALLARTLAFVSLVAATVAEASRGLHGRPTVSALQLIELGMILAFVGWAFRRLLVWRRGYFLFFLVAFLALYEGSILISTLLNGFVLVALPAVVVRVATVLCLGTGAGLLPLTFRLSSDGQSRRRDRDDALDGEDESFAESFA